eukprot:3436152-Pleurochrysis_carterae.AAC.3
MNAALEPLRAAEAPADPAREGVGSAGLIHADALCYSGSVCDNFGRGDTYSYRQLSCIYQMIVPDGAEVGQ